ncbi:hypothetical protein EV144_10754 [Flavobacterium sp. 270]|nr:hypothetical protein EV144_10754 [Flavobacterium sp. 270]
MVLIDYGVVNLRLILKIKENPLLKTTQKNKLNFMRNLNLLN